MHKIKIINKDSIANRKRMFITSICENCNYRCCRDHLNVHYKNAFFKFPEYIQKEQYTMYLNSIQREANRTNKCQHFKKYC